MSIHNDTLDIGQLRIMLKCSHVETCFLAKLCDARPVVVTKHSICQNSICHIRKGHEVDLQDLKYTGSHDSMHKLILIQKKTKTLMIDLSLQECMLWKIWFQNIQQKCCCFTNHVPLDKWLIKKDVRYEEF